VGRLVDKRLTDELGNQIGVVIDGIDGKVHHVAMSDSAAAEDAPIGAIVDVGSVPSQRPADRNIAAIATGVGEYRPSVHRNLAEAQGSRVPGGDYDAYIDAHVRRLEALRRAAIVARVDADRWRIPEDFEQRAAAYDAARARRVSLRVLCSYDLDRQITSDGATWLDRELIGRDRKALSTGGFGAEVRQALKDRQTELIRRGHMRQTADGGLTARADLIGTLRRQEVDRVGRELAATRSRTYIPIKDGETVRGTLVGSAQLASGRFAMIDDGLGFSLVPWRPVIENQIGRQVVGVMRGGDISWQLGRGLRIGM
jgi:hypothetical protein